jgi:hypothetical protein
VQKLFGLGQVYVRSQEEEKYREDAQNTIYLLRKEMAEAKLEYLRGQAEAAQEQARAAQKQAAAAQEKRDLLEEASRKIASLTFPRTQERDWGSTRPKTQPSTPERTKPRMRSSSPRARSEGHPSPGGQAEARRVSFGRLPIQEEDDPRHYENASGEEGETQRDRDWSPAEGEQEWTQEQVDEFQGRYTSWEEVGPDHSGEEPQGPNLRAVAEELRRMLEEGADKVPPIGAGAGGLSPTTTPEPHHSGGATPNSTKEDGAMSTMFGLLKSLAEASKAQAEALTKGLSPRLEFR